MGEVVYLPVPDKLTAEQKQHWLDEAARWGVIEEEAARNREEALRMLGMLGIERGLDG